MSMQTAAAAAGAVMVALALLGCGSDGGDPPGGTGGDAGAGGAQGEGGSADGGGGAGAQGGGGRWECEILDLQPGEVGPGGAVALFRTDDAVESIEGSALSGGYVYFSADYQLLRVPVAGGAAETLGDLPSGRHAIVGDTLVWTEELSSQRNVRLLAAPVTSLSASTVLAEDILPPAMLALDATNAYYDQGDPQAIWKVALAGGSAPEVLVPSGHPLGMISHDGALYWLDFQTEQLERVPREGGTREPLAEVFFGGPMAAAGESVFWTDTSLHTVNRWRDGAAAIDVLHDIERVPNADPAPSAIAVSGDTVYWLQGFGCVELWQVKTDGTGARRTASGFFLADGLAVDEGHVVVVGREAVYRVDR
ncbi:MULTISPECIES: hypothetical protein [Sorangium]|uniref:hypothetical protein n=1 Tax=Sorangium TaxID=39643 RepID=UPI001A90D2B0|nr:MULTISPECIES: hypothetical protein [Sorangium]